MDPHHRGQHRQNCIEWHRPRITSVAQSCLRNDFLPDIVRASTMAKTYQLYVGVDIAAKTFTATWAQDPATAPKAVTFEQTEAGFTRFQLALATSGVTPQAT